MNTTTESKPVVIISEEAKKTENPMQERYCGEVTESVGMTAEAAFTARRHEARAEQSDALSSSKGRSIREETGPIFIP